MRRTFRRRVLMPPMRTRQVLADGGIELTHVGDWTPSIGYEFRVGASQSGAAGLYRIINVVDGKMRAQRIGD